MKKIIYLAVITLSLTFTNCGGDDNETFGNTSTKTEQERKVVTSSKGRIIYKNSKGRYYYYKDNDKSKERVYVEQWACGTHKGKQLYTGPRGGCYYINSRGNKTYVDRGECNCS